MGFQLRTKHGYELSIAISAVQKEIRRGHVLQAGFWANEVYTSGYYKYLWRRLLVISAEDCEGLITQEVKALYDSAMTVIKDSKGNYSKGRIFMGKALVLLIKARKNRDADHINNFTHLESNLISQNDIEEALEQIDSHIEETTYTDAASRYPTPDYIMDCHTRIGKQQGKTQQQFFTDEFEALNNRTIGLLDSYVGKAIVKKPSYPEKPNKDYSLKDDPLVGVEEFVLG